MMDSYKAPEFYKEHIKASETGFISFTADDHHYFAYAVDGEVVLISPPYKAVAGRDNGIASTTKHMKNEDRYTFSTPADGSTVFSLTSGFGQELAISPPWPTEADARAIASRLMDGKSAGPLKVKSTRGEPLRPQTAKPKAPKVMPAPTSHSEPNSDDEAAKPDEIANPIPINPQPTPPAQVIDKDVRVTPPVQTEPKRANKTLWLGVPLIGFVLILGYFGLKAGDVIP